LRHLRAPPERYPGEPACPQAHLRACAHVRDGILDECCAALGRSELRHKPSRDDLQRILVECGAMHDLIAMENCITLVASKAG